MELWTTAEEARRLARRFDGVNQAEFARANKIKGGSSMLNQHIHGRRPMSLDAAIAYAHAFGCRLEEISPRLAASVHSAAVKEVVGKGAVGRAASDGADELKAALLFVGSAIANTNQQTREALAGMLASYAKDPKGGAAIAEAIALLLKSQPQHEAGKANRRSA